MAGNAAVAAPEADARKLAEAKEKKGLEVGDFVPAKIKTEEVAGRDERDAGSPAGLRLGDDVGSDDDRAKNNATATTATATATATNYKEAMKKRLGEEEHTAISQVLSMQQEQFEQQVQELHTISQRQWGQVSRTLFPYLESFRPVPSGGALNPTAASPLFAAPTVSDQQQAAAVTAMNQAAAAMNAQAGQAWWQDPAKVMGMKVMPSLVHASVSNQMQNSSQMESTMIGSHHPSQLFSQQQQHQGGQSSAATAVRTAGSHQRAGPSGAGSCARGFGDAGTHGNNRHSGVGSHQTQGQGGSLSALAGHGHGVKRSLSSRAESEDAPATANANAGAKLAETKAPKRQREAGPGPSGAPQHPSSAPRQPGDFDGTHTTTKVAAPKPKVATPQSAIDILLALSEASTGDAKAASQLRNQQHQIHPTQSKGAQAAAAPAAADLASPQGALAPVAAAADERET